MLPDAVMLLIGTSSGPSRLDALRAGENMSHEQTSGVYQTTSISRYIHGED
jgi:hypothetical protein